MGAPTTSENLDEWYGPYGHANNNDRKYKHDDDNNGNGIVSSKDCGGTRGTTGRRTKTTTTTKTTTSYTIHIRGRKSPGIVSWIPSYVLVDVGYVCCTTRAP